MVEPGIPNNLPANRLSNSGLLQRQILYVYLSVVISILIVVSTGLITESVWYSGGTAYRLQTDAFMNGNLGLSDTPTSMLYDYCWTKGQMQQVWGLGVPAWRLPFEVIARMLNSQWDFPDRIAFAIACALAIYLFLNFVSQFQSSDSLSKHIAEKKSQLLLCAGALLIIFAFPSFITICRSRFLVYEEAVAYAYLYGVSLFLGLLLYYRSRSFALFCFLMLFAGIGPLVRPTLVFYGGTTLAMLSWIAFCQNYRWRRFLIGWALFGAGMGLLFATNWLRFGHPMEFGHSLNITDPGISYATRFENNYAEEPFFSAAKELAGALFFPNEFINDIDWYQRDMWHGQSESLRWRENYFSTYDVYTAILVGLSWIWGTTSLLNNFKNRKLSVQQSLKIFFSRDTPSLDKITLQKLITIWTVCSFVPLAYFYMYSPALTSRYLVDFGPAFSISIMGLWIQWMTFSQKKSKIFSFVTLLFLIGWLGTAISTAQFEPGRQGLRRIHDGKITDVERFRAKKLAAPQLPEKYSIGDDLAQYEISENGHGWDLSTGENFAVATVFVDDPDEVTVTVTRLDEKEVTPGDIQNIRVKIGLEELEQKSILTEDSTWKIVFFAPENGKYRSGVHTLYLTMMPPEDVGREQYSKLKLLSIKWR